MPPITTPPIKEAAKALLDKSRALALSLDKPATHLPAQPLPAAEAISMLGMVDCVREQLQLLENAIAAQALPTGGHLGMSLSESRPRFVAGVQVQEHTFDSCLRLHIILRDVELPLGTTPQVLPLRQALRLVRPWPSDLPLLAEPAQPVGAAQPVEPFLDAALATPVEPVKEVPPARRATAAHLRPEGAPTAPVLPGKPAAAPVAAGAPPAAASTTPAASGEQRPTLPATDRQLDVIRDQLGNKFLTDEEKALVQASLGQLDRRQASETIETLGAWIKDRKNRPLTITTPGPIYYFYYRRAHRQAGQGFATVRPYRAESFAHAYELFDKYLKSVVALATTKGFLPKVELLAVNGYELSESEYFGHLNDESLNQIESLAEQAEPPRLPQGSTADPDPL